MAYTIRIKETIGGTPGWGDFTVRKSFVVMGAPPANGIIIQKIEKSTRVNVPGLGKVHTTTEAIEDFTSGCVGDACRPYYEVFPVLNGKSTEADQFQNGALLRYVEDGGEPVADDTPRTYGRITIVGTNVFVPLPEEEVATLVAAMKKGGKVVPSIILLGEEWNLRTNTPANGLPFRERFDGFDALPGGRVVHMVEVSWGGPKGTTNVTSSITPLPAKPGGTRRKARRKTRRATRSRVRR